MFILNMKEDVKILCNYCPVLYTVVQTVKNYTVLVGPI